MAKHDAYDGLIARDLACEKLEIEVIKGAKDWNQTTFVLKMARPPHLMTLADLSVPQIKRILNHSLHCKRRSQSWIAPQKTGVKKDKMRLPSQSLFGKSIAIMFSKRSTRTRLAAETSVELLGGKTIFLGKDDIQLGVNESLRDSARVIGGMCQGIFARVGEHEEIEVRHFRE